MRSFSVRLAFCLPLLTHIGAVHAWEFSNHSGIITAAELVDGWGTFFSGNKSDAIFCFTGPFIVEKGLSYTTRIKVGSGQWFDAPLVAEDDKTLCTFETSKALGLLGAIGKHGALGFGLNIDGNFRHVIFYAGNLSDYIPR